MRHQNPSIAQILRLGGILLLFFLPSIVANAASTTKIQHDDWDPNKDFDVDGRRYLLIGVSGGLQDDFPDHVKMDYRDQEGNFVRAIFVGRALVRGTKAFLDVMEEGWRQYTPEPGQPLINSVNIVSGCYEHANQYWIYLVDSRQLINILNNEPRFLGITPDTGLVDLRSNETEETVRAIALAEIQRLGFEDQNYVAIPIVVAPYYHRSFVPSPAIRVHEDGTQVTNFPESLAIWAQVDDLDRVAVADVGMCAARQEDDEAKEQCLREETARVDGARARYWAGIRKAVRHAEVNRLSEEESARNGPPFECQQKAVMGTSPDQLRLNYAFLPSRVKEIFHKVGLINFDAGEMYRLTESETMEVDMTGSEEIADDAVVPNATLIEKLKAYIAMAR